MGGWIEDRIGLCVVWEVPSGVWVSVWDSRWFFTFGVFLWFQMLIWREGQVRCLKILLLLSYKLKLCIESRRKCIKVVPFGTKCEKVGILYNGETCQMPTSRRLLGRWVWIQLGNFFNNLLLLQIPGVLLFWKSGYNVEFKQMGRPPEWRLCYLFHELIKFASLPPNPGLWGNLISGWKWTGGLWREGWEWQWILSE